MHYHQICNNNNNKYHYYIYNLFDKDLNETFIQLSDTQAHCIFDNDDGNAINNYNLGDYGDYYKMRKMMIIIITISNNKQNEKIGSGDNANEHVIKVVSLVFIILTTTTVIT